MAVTKIIPIRSTIQNSIDYICNPDKTDDRLLVHSEHCFPNTAGLEFQYYLSQTRAGGNTIGRHLIQSFAPGEVSPEQAHEIGKKLAAEVLEGEYAFVMATHVDRGHVHNHFVWCAANIVTHKKYRSNKNTYHNIRKASDRLCNENELSVIVPQGNGKSYSDYFPEKTSESWRGKLQAAINNLIPESQDFEDLIKRLEAQGYKIKRGKYISFSAPGQGRFTRLKSLGEDFNEEAIKQKISQKHLTKKAERAGAATDLKLPVNEPAVEPVDMPTTIKPLIDIAGNPKYAENRGLEQWAKLQNLKNTAQAYILMEEYGGTKAFSKLLSDCRNDVETIENAIKANNERKTSLGYWRETIAAYNRTKPIYKQYTETKLFKEQFRRKHESDIMGHEIARNELKGLKRPLPKLKELSAQIKRIDDANTTNRKSLTKKKAELNRLKYVHSYLHQIKRENELSQPRKQKNIKTQEQNL